MKRFLILSVAVFVVFCFGSSFAAFNGGIPENGPHYNLNIIGVAKDKKVNMDGSDRHTIFVPLNAEGQVPRTVKIYGSSGFVVHKSC